MAAPSLWAETAPPPPTAPPLQGKTFAELLVIGGGFTGCSAALAAAEMGADVLLIEAEALGHGGSGRNVGLVNAGLWTPPDEVERLLGTEAGQRLNTALAGAPDLVFALIERHAIACEATRSGTLHCAHSPRGLRALQTRHAQGIARGHPLSLLDARETAARTGSARFHGALHDARAGTLQPLAYCRGLAQAAAVAGARLHGQSAVVNLAHDGQHWQATTAEGHVSARAVLLATNGYHRAITGVDDPPSIPVHYAQFATVPLSGNVRGSILSGGEGAWDTDAVMSSVRLDAAGRLIVGGVGSLEHPGAGIHRRWAERKLARLFPQAAGTAIVHAWSGRIAMSADHLPRIRRLGPSGLTIYGYSGRGIGPGTLFGRAAAEALLSGDEARLPLAPIDGEPRRASTLKRQLYLLGPVLAHWTRGWR